MSSGHSAVADFYRNKNLFITGGTGFLGLGLIEKALRSLDTGNIYLLMRAKKGKSMQERLDELTQNDVFETLLEKHGGAAANRSAVFKRLIPIEGDVGAEHLGISPADRRVLIDNVNVVIHSAATLDFNQTLRSTVTINLLGTRRVMELCDECKHLQAAVHVSSAYVNSFLLQTEEMLYPMPGTEWQQVEELVRTLNDAELEARTPAIIGIHPNTYTFTKHMAEHEVHKYAERVPVGIMRPSMVQPAWKEPVPGWTISKNGPQAFLMGASKGVLRRLPGDTTLIADYIPIDTVVNQLLVTGWVTGTKNNASVPIFHCTTSTCNPFTWDLVKENMNDYVNRYPLMSSVWYPQMQIVRNLTAWRISVIFVHFLPAIILDTLLRVVGGRPILWRMHRNVWNSLNLLERFVFTEWRYDNKRTLELAERMGAADVRDFNIDVRSLQWDPYFLTLVAGVRRYLSKEHPRTLPAALRRNKIMLVLHYGLQVSLHGLIWWLTKTLLGLGWSQTVIVLPFAWFLLNLI